MQEQRAKSVISKDTWRVHSGIKLTVEEQSETMSNHSSTKAFYSWICAAPAIAAIGLMVLEHMDFGANVGILLPLIGIIVIAVLFVTALAVGLSTRTTLASLLGMFTGLVLTVVVGVSLI
ncbi:hypothetical protein [Massilia sp. YIM B02443]|uniref:hypothetical protein n=1 Tax=Massilia sp. YIM B02443 TaxID=3050127 RepID=UPI0025B70D04|nr:hypothetical protein [Massilia sp. YIM B02443]MDN4037506.1 hypothetical protein [Massilia sp. YIM B02443]